MSNQDITLTLEKRDVVGKGLNKLKQSGQIPAVIHNHGSDSIIVSGAYTDVVKVFQLAGKHHPVSVKVDSDTYLTIIKDADFEPKKNKLRHVVFGAIRQDEKVETEVPIVFVGDAPAEKAGLMVIKQLDHVEIEALPRDLVDELKISIEKLAEIGDRITVADLDIPNGVTILTEPEHPIAVVEETKAQISEEEEAAEAAEGEEGEAAEGDTEEGTTEGSNESKKDNREN